MDQSRVFWTLLSPLDRFVTFVGACEETVGLHMAYKGLGLTWVHKARKNLLNLKIAKDFSGFSKITKDLHGFN